jgi:Family of unknown function (DUF6283)
MADWKLKRTQQCDKCPWRVETDPTMIPNGYSVAAHRALVATIAAPCDVSLIGQPQHIMACHEKHDAHCIGWLAHQMSVGNNLALRLSLLSCDNLGALRLRGAQHPTFADTLPPTSGSR